MWTSRRTKLFPGLLCDPPDVAFHHPGTKISNLPSKQVLSIHQLLYSSQMQNQNPSTPFNLRFIRSFWYLSSASRFHLHIPTRPTRQIPSPHRLHAFLFDWRAENQDTLKLPEQASFNVVSVPVLLRQKGWEPRHALGTTFSSHRAFLFTPQTPNLTFPLRQVFAASVDYGGFYINQNPMPQRITPP
jgi:hypothetical protein